MLARYVQAALTLAVKHRNYRRADAIVPGVGQLALDPVMVITLFVEESRSHGPDILFIVAEIAQGRVDGSFTQGAVAYL
ncbi:hypothetical protein C4J81_01990 [Deltaproteobacteria bacterium Smac51]|nr:hypothetical protein C4J81_01990 [Deltaproteobacteria bacterium Smac51]